MSITRQGARLSAGASVANSTTTNGPIGDCSLVFQATEANTQTISRSAGKYSQLYCDVFSNSVSGSSTLKFRKGAANGTQSISIGSGATGTFFDEVGTDSVVAADKVNVQIITAVGIGTMVLRTIGISFSATVNTVKRLSLTGSFTTTAASTTFFVAPGGTLSSGNSVEGNMKLNIPLPSGVATLKNLMVNVTAAAATATTVRTRKNGANGALSLSFTATGQFEDSTNSDSLSNQDLIDISIVTGTGTSTRTITYIGIDLVTTNNSYMFAGNAGTPITIAAGGLGAWGIGDGTNSSESSTGFVCDLVEMICRNLFINITANSLTGTAFFALRENAATSGFIIIIPAGTTGIFFNGTPGNTTLYGATDTLNFAYSSVVGGTSISIGPYGVGVEVSMVPETPPRYPDYIDNPIQVESY